MQSEVVLVTTVTVVVGSYLRVCSVGPGVRMGNSEKSKQRCTTTRSKKAEKNRRWEELNGE